MRPADRIKATLAAAGITYEEFSQLCGISRQSLYHYFRPNIYMEDYPKGARCIRIARILWSLCENRELPLKETDGRLELLKAMVERDSVKVHS